MKLLWTTSSKESYELLKTDAPELAEKVKSLLKDTVLHPDRGSGSPTKLEREYSNLWQRTYAPGQVIIYSVHEDTVTNVSIGAKETALQNVNLESYSKEDEQSVMGQMAANRGKDGDPLEEFNLPPEKTKAMYAVHWDIGQTWR